MNKKLFSAALFGALLLGTASTFVSCKDYDDDIAGLQTQINDVKAAVSALESKVNAGKFVTSVTSTADGITIALSDGSSYTVKNGKDGNDGAPGANGNDGAPGADAQQVTIDETTGELLINGEGTGIKPATEAATEEFKAPVKAEGGFWYVLNEDGEYDNTNIPVSPVTVTGNDLTGYVLTVYNADGTSTVVALPTAASALNTIEVKNATTPALTGYFTATNATDEATCGIYWSAATSAKDWAGPKGAIAKNQLLVGQISDVVVSVTPATYALDQQALNLVASDGSIAPVSVAAYSGWRWDAETTGTRAWIPSGMFGLYITMDETITAQNIATAFTKNGENLKYALAVNGKIVTGYKFVIDTQTKAESNANSNLSILATELSNYNSTTTSWPVSVGTSYITYDNAKAYDSYLSFTGTNVAKAKTLGVTVDGNKIVVPASAGGQTLTVTVNVIDVLGKVQSVDALLTLGTAEITSEAVATTTYKVMPTATRSNLVVDLSTAFDGMTEAQVESVTTAGQITLTVKDGKGPKFVYDTTTAQYAKAINADKTVKTAFNAATDDLRDLNYLVIPSTTVQSTAEAGSYTLVMTIKDGNGNEIKKINMPVDVTLPTFDEIFTKSAAWDGSTLILNLDNSGNADFTTAYKYTIGGGSTLNIAFDNIDNSSPVNSGTSTNITIDNSVVVANGAAKNATAQAKLTIAGASNLVVKSDKFTVKFVSPLYGASLAYYVNGAVADITIDGDGGEIAAFVAGNPSATPATKDEGLAMILKGTKNAMTTVAGVAFVQNTNTFFSFDAKAGNNAGATLTSGKIDVSGLAASQYTTNLTIKVKDGNGIVTTFVLPIKVNN